MLRIKISYEKMDAETPMVRKGKTGQSILGICLDNQVKLRHECGGICACSTCHVYIKRGQEHLEEAGQREKDMLTRAVKSTNHSRLACQCVIRGKKGEIDVVIPAHENAEGIQSGED
jgi:2Fe-2S ferredoxin